MIGSSEQFTLNPPAYSLIRAIVDYFIALTGITRLTKRLNIIDIGRTSLRYWDNMIGGQLNIVASTAQAFITKVITQVFKFGSRVASARLCFSRAAAMFARGAYFGISLLISAVSFVYGIGIGVIITEGLLPIGVDVGLSTAAGIFVCGVAIVLAVAATILLPCFGVFPSVSVVALPETYYTVAAVVPLASAALLARFSVTLGHKKLLLACQQELNYNHPATRRLSGLSSRLGVFTALPGLLLVLNYITCGALEQHRRVYF